MSILTSTSLEINNPLISPDNESGAIALSSSSLFRLIYSLLLVYTLSNTLSDDLFPLFSIIVCLKPHSCGASLGREWLTNMQFMSWPLGGDIHTEFWSGSFRN